MSTGWTGWDKGLLPPPMTVVELQELRKSVEDPMWVEDDPPYGREDVLRLLDEIKRLRIINAQYDMPGLIYRGACGHYWRKTTNEPCPICIQLEEARKR